MIFRLTLRRSAWIRWLPPIESMSPSPPITHTSRSGRAERDAGGDRGRPAVDRVQAVGVHVVREARRAADARHEHQVLRASRRARRSCELHRGEDRVVTAARAPADLLVRLEVLPAELDRGAAAVSDPLPSLPFASSLSGIDHLHDRVLDLGGAERQALHLGEATARRPGTPPAPASTAGRGSSRGPAPSGTARAPRRGSPGTG